MADAFSVGVPILFIVVTFMYLHMGPGEGVSMLGRFGYLCLMSSCLCYGTGKLLYFYENDVRVFYDIAHVSLILFVFIHGFLELERRGTSKLVNFISATLGRNR